MSCSSSTYCWSVSSDSALNFNGTPENGSISSIVYLNSHARLETPSILCGVNNYDTQQDTAMICGTSIFTRFVRLGTNASSDVSAIFKDQFLKKRKKNNTLWRWLMSIHTKTQLWYLLGNSIFDGTVKLGINASSDDTATFKTKAFARDAFKARYYLRLQK